MAAASTSSAAVNLTGAAAARAAAARPLVTNAATGVTSVAGLDLANGTFRIWQSPAVGEKLVQREVKHTAPAPDEVIVKIHASGICQTDCDCVKGKFGNMMVHPMVAGHEGVGTVVATGAAVPKTLKIGTHVGLGCFRSACYTCLHCAKGDTNLCDNSVLIFAKGDYGTFAEYSRIKYQFAIPIPDSVEDVEAVAPLFCAGATVYAPFVNHNVKPGDSVAILGIGGLGHLALQIARAWGCDVTALSGTASKKDQLLKLGAHHFVDTKADPELKSVAGKYDMLLVCTSNGETNWNALLSTLRKNGRLVLAGLPTMKDLPISPMALIFGQLTVAGSLAGSNAHYNSMIQFCAKHKIVPTNEKFAFDDINEAMSRVEAGTVRFRAVVSFGLNKFAGASTAAKK